MAHTKVSINGNVLLRNTWSEFSTLKPSQGHSHDLKMIISYALKDTSSQGLFNNQKVKAAFLGTSSPSWWSSSTRQRAGKKSIKKFEQVKNFSSQLHPVNCTQGYKFLSTFSWFTLISKDWHSLDFRNLNREMEELGG